MKCQIFCPKNTRVTERMNNDSTMIIFSGSFLFLFNFFAELTLVRGFQPKSMVHHVGRDITPLVRLGELWVNTASIYHLKKGCATFLSVGHITKLRHLSELH